MPQPDMPTYICHKRVKALEINVVLEPVGMDGGQFRNVFFVDGRFNPVFLPERMFARYVPTRGDFLVTYEDGYQSFSPRQTFLDGYTAEGQSFSQIKQELKP